MLVIRPELMFDEEGVWKEFRIGGDRRRYTYMPFWLFAILWAIISFVLVHLLSRAVNAPQNFSQNQQLQYSPNNIQYVPESVKVPKRRGTSAPLPPGYYMLNKEAFNGTGTPHYVYIGPTPEAVDLDTTVGNEL